ncbi:MAG TPA: cysteine desulfurase [Polyangiaceae bacterium]|nr:cysteine desulfurase [Polyangiaceae bacterium]
MSTRINRADFPALDQEVHGAPLVYLDSAATALKPQSVIDAVAEVYAMDCANIHRAVHTLSQRATKSYEGAREKARAFLNAKAKSEIIFTAGTTASINLVAQAWARPRLKQGDKILISGLEHHSNIVPWQMVCQQTGASLVVVPITDRGEVPLAAIEAELDERVKLVAMNHVSNALGTIQDAKAIAAAAHRVGAKVLFDGAQAVAHLPVDVQDIDADFYAFSAHKLYGPTGIGILYGKEALLDEAEPYQGGGDMIRSVTFEKTTYAGLPAKLEAGTPNIAGAIGLGAAIDYVEAIGRDTLYEHEQGLLGYATEALSAIEGLRLVGTSKHKAGVLSFVLDCAHPHDIGTIVDGSGVAIRTGHHCAQPVMERFQIPATARASLGMYNTPADIDALVAAIGEVRRMFA